MKGIKHYFQQKENFALNYRHTSKLDQPKYMLMSLLLAKGQLFLKADWPAIDSLKKPMDEFVLFAFLLFTANIYQIRPFIS